MEDARNPGFQGRGQSLHLAGESYSELKDILATEDELTPVELRYKDPSDTWEIVFGRSKPSS